MPFLGKHAKQLYVVQRTPSTVDERNNAPTDPEWAKILKAGLAEGTGATSTLLVLKGWPGTRNCVPED